MSKAAPHAVGGEQIHGPPIIVAHFADGRIVVPGCAVLVHGLEQIAAALEAIGRDIGRQGEFRHLHLPDRIGDQNGLKAVPRLPAPGK